MRIWQSIKNATVKFFWPWFKEFIWPLILKFMKDMIDFALDLLKELLKDWASQRAKDKEKEANQKAEGFEKEANASNDDREADNLRKTAKVWREVAEYFRQESETLQRKIDELSRKAKEKAFEEADNSKIDLDFSGERPTLSIGDSTHSLPEFLPPPR